MPEHPDTARRYLLGGGLLVAGGFLGLGALIPTGSSWAGVEGRTELTARTLPDALRSLGIREVQESHHITLLAPDIAENGARVEIEVSTTLTGVESMMLLVDNNPFPFCSTLNLAPDVAPWARMQIKLAEHARIRALIRTGDGKTHVAMRDIRVTQGSCGAG